MTRAPRPKAPTYQDDTYQPFADAALADPQGVIVTFEGESSKARARQWQSQFCKWRTAAGLTYFVLTTRRARVSVEPEVWEVAILTHQTARAGVKVRSAATGEAVDLDQFDAVLIARKTGLAELMAEPDVSHATTARFLGSPVPKPLGDFTAATERDVELEDLADDVFTPPEED